MTRKRVLIIEDNHVDARLISEIVGRYALPISTDSLQGALEIIRQQSLDAVVLDLTLTDSASQNTMDTMTLAGYRGSVIVVTGSNDEAMREYATKNRWHWVFKDSFDYTWKLESFIRMAMDLSDDRELEMSQLSVISTTLQRIEKQQTEDAKKLARVYECVYGKERADGTHEPGCVERCKPIIDMMQAGKIKTWQIIVGLIVCGLSAAVSAIVARVIH